MDRKRCEDNKKVSPTFQPFLEDLTKTVLRNQPVDIYPSLASYANNIGSKRVEGEVKTLYSRNAICGVSRIVPPTEISSTSLSPSKCDLVIKKLPELTAIYSSSKQIHKSTSKKSPSKKTYGLRNLCSTDSNKGQTGESVTYVSVIKSTSSVVTIFPGPSQPNKEKARNTKDLTKNQYVQQTQRGGNNDKASDPSRPLPAPKTKENVDGPKNLNTLVSQNDSRVQGPTQIFTEEKTPDENDILLITPELAQSAFRPNAEKASSLPIPEEVLRPIPEEVSRPFLEEIPISLRPTSEEFSILLLPPPEEVPISSRPVTEEDDSSASRPDIQLDEPYFANKNVVNEPLESKTDKEPGVITLQKLKTMERKGPRTSLIPIPQARRKNSEVDMQLIITPPTAFREETRRNSPLETLLLPPTNTEGNTNHQRIMIEPPLKNEEFVMIHLTDDNPRKESGNGAKPNNTNIGVPEQSEPFLESYLEIRENKSRERVFLKLFMTDTVDTSLRPVFGINPISTTNDNLASRPDTKLNLDRPRPCLGNKKTMKSTEAPSSIGDQPKATLRECQHKKCEKQSSQLAEQEQRKPCKNKENVIIASPTAFRKKCRLNSPQVDTLLIVNKENKGNQCSNNKPQRETKQCGNSERRESCRKDSKSKDCEEESCWSCAYETVNEYVDKLSIYLAEKGNKKQQRSLNGVIWFLSASIFLGLTVGWIFKRNESDKIPGCFLNCPKWAAMSHFSHCHS